MTSLFDRNLKERKAEREKIDQRVRSGHLNVKEGEKEIIDGLIREISGQFRQEITSKEPGLDDLDQKITEAVRDKAKNLDLSYEDKKRIEHIATANMIGLGPIQPYMEDAQVTEIIVQRFDNICIEKKGRVYETRDSFTDEEHLKNVINRILQPVGRQINLSIPIADARLLDGSRVCATIPPVSPHGATLTIRKFQNERMTPSEYVRLNSISREGMEILKLFVEQKLTIAVSGSTGCGKTTLLNILSAFLPPQEILITIEDVLELQLRQKNVRSLETRQVSREGMMHVDMAQLVKTALRCRPDRIIVGETRDHAILQFLNAASTGHEGSMTTVHANSPRNLVDVRLPIMMSSDPNMRFSEEAQQMLIAESIQIIVQLKRLPDGRRVVSRICAVNGVGGNRHVKIEDVLIYNEIRDTFDCTWLLPKELYDRIALSKREIAGRFRVLTESSKKQRDKNARKDRENGAEKPEVPGTGKPWESGRMSQEGTA